MNTSAPLAYTSFCEFFVWITKECHLERIAFDPAFWEVQVQKNKITLQQGNNARAHWKIFYQTDANTGFKGKN